MRKQTNALQVEHPDCPPYFPDDIREEAYRMLEAADYFASALQHLHAAAKLIREVDNSNLDHWHPSEPNSKARFTPSQNLSEQIISVRIEEATQRRMSRFFEAWVLVKTLPLSTSPEYSAALTRLERLRIEDESSQTSKQDPLK